jgi:hypothetical protein
MLSNRANSAVLIIDDRGLSIDTSKCPFRLPDGRTFQGVFRLNCLETSNCTASFKGNIILEKPSSENRFPNTAEKNETRKDINSSPEIQFSVEGRGIVVDTSVVPLVLANGRKFQGVFKVMCPSNAFADGTIALDLDATFNDVASTRSLHVIPAANPSPRSFHSPQDHRSDISARHPRGHEPRTERAEDGSSASPRLHPQPAGAARPSRTKSDRRRSTSPPLASAVAAARASSDSAATSSLSYVDTVADDSDRVRHRSDTANGAEPDTRELYRSFLEKRRLAAAAADATARPPQPPPPPADDRGVGRAASAPDGPARPRPPSVEMAASASVRARRGRSVDLQRPRSASLDAARPRPAVTPSSPRSAEPSPPQHHHKAPAGGGARGRVASGCGLGRLLRLAAAAVLSGPTAHRGRH